MRQYILDENHNPVPEFDLIKWAYWFEGKGNRIVKQQHVGTVFVSTVFLGLDHQFGDGPPILFESMTFPGQRENRCCTWQEAEQMHLRMCREARSIKLQLWGAWQWLERKLHAINRLIEEYL